MKDDDQLSLSLTGPSDPVIADSEAVVFRPSQSKLPAEYSDAELLTTVLGPSTAALCGRLASAHDGFRTIGMLSPAELIDHGFTARAVNLLCAIVEIAKRYGESEFKIGTQFRGSADIYAHYRERLATEPCEVFYAVLLDNKHRKLRDILVSKGSLTSAIVHPRDVFAQVVRHSAAAILLVHNHPSGDPTPSQEDIALTRRLREVGELVGVRVLDHIVIGKGSYVSFVEGGYW